ncbi:PQQ-binding-like beta-propeller repeat protein [Streptomyces tricolor]|nr:PQQ-binding-like beta-propeller repeat protein [Streptomyces tricolor]
MDPHPRRPGVRRPPSCSAPTCWSPSAARTRAACAATPPTAARTRTATTPAGPTGTPVVAAGTVYTGSYGDALLALDARDGSRKWQVSAGADVTVLALAGTTPLHGLRRNARVTASRTAGGCRGRRPTPVR